MATRTDDTTRLIFPVGHLVGQAGGSGWSVRIGNDLHRFESEADFTMWGLAHGDQDRVGVAPWTVGDLTASPGGADARLRRLLSDGTLVAVGTGTLEATAFARTHRLVPLMHGLSDPPSTSDTYGLGVTFHSQPSAYLSEDLYVIWRLSPFATSLLDLAGQLSRQALESGIDEADAGVDVVLNDVLELLHVILAQHAGYLDRARS